VTLGLCPTLEIFLDQNVFFFVMFMFVLAIPNLLVMFMFVVTILSLLAMFMFVLAIPNFACYVHVCFGHSKFCLLCSCLFWPFQILLAMFMFVLAIPNLLGAQHFLFSHHNFLPPPPMFMFALAIPICLVPNTCSFYITNFLSFCLPPIFMYVSAFLNYM